MNIILVHQLRSDWGTSGVRSRRESTASSLGTLVLIVGEHDTESYTLLGLCLLWLLGWIFISRHQPLLFRSHIDLLAHSRWLICFLRSWQGFLELDLHSGHAHCGTGLQIYGVEASRCHWLVGSGDSRSGRCARLMFLHCAIVVEAVLVQRSLRWQQPRSGH